ncbi:MAG: DUF4430 domain-containing protein [Actinomycetota bacterium]|nr:DUF4430 domain-containing protein [Actinomycetota bacterium]
MPSIRPRPAVALRLRRPLVTLGVLAAVLVLAAPALAVRVHVRVEGAAATIFGATEPLLTPARGSWSPPEGPSLSVQAETPLGALERASRLGEFYYRVRASDFGPYVDRIGRLAAAATTGWVYKVNGVSPPVGADKYVLRAGDRVLWYFARFGPAGGPKTLAFHRTKCPGGVQAVAVDDNGRAKPATNVVFEIDGRRVRDRNGAICPRGHWHTLRATKPGTVRSRVVRNPRRAAQLQESDRA